MKRFFAFLIFCVMFTMNVNADIIFEPNNNFYSRNRDKCEYMGRSFYANGEDGFVSLKREPGSAAEEMKVENGGVLYISHTYDDNGEVWGVAEIWGPSRLNGWIPMNQLVLVYDYIAFAEDFGDKFYDYDGDYTELESAEKIVVWKYPGGEQLAAAAEKFVYDGNSWFNQINHVYKDEREREWGFISASFHGRNIWVCLSEPDNEDIPAIIYPQAEIYPPADIEANPVTKESPMIYIIIMTAALIAGTAILIRVFWKPAQAG